MLMPKEQANKDFWTNTVNQNIEKLALPYQEQSLKEKLAEVAS